jgi:tRNA pseudouridine55 synthase
VKRILNVKKISHAGTLDPLAEGVMIVLTDGDCKIQDSFMKQDKEYEANILLGAFSESYDLEKPLIFEEKAPELNQILIEEVLNSLKGEVSLPVPLFSAKIVGGKRLYKYARSGKSISSVPMMNSVIYDIELLESSFYDYFGQKFPIIKILVKCSSGTYIRTLANEIGIRYGTKGVLFHLKRTKVGEFSVIDSKTENSLLV